MGCSCNKDVNLCSVPVVQCKCPLKNVLAMTFSKFSLLQYYDYTELVSPLYILLYFGSILTLGVDATVKFSTLTLVLFLEK